MRAVTRIGTRRIYRLVIDPVQPALIEALRPVISDERLNAYLMATGFDQDRALRLYLWNAQIGEAFHLPIQAIEVGLRNRIEAALSEVFGPEWWQDPRMLAIVDDDRRADLALVLKRIRNRKLTLGTGQVVAGLSFGFWVGMLQARYNPGLWGGRLHKVFPDYPANRNRATLAATAGRAAWLRNRIWHHEPVMKLDLSLEYATLMKLLGWISAAKADWVRANCRVPILLRQKP